MKFWVRLLAVLSLSVSASAQDAAQSDLNNARQKFAETTVANYDKGGPISHYQWLNYPAFRPAATIYQVGKIRSIPMNKRSDVANKEVRLGGEPTSVQNYINSDGTIDGVIILHRGKNVFETYPNMKPYERHLTWSVSKVIVSTALASLQDQGRVDMRRSVETYVPLLVGTDWEGISVQNIANMASGMACIESATFTDPTECSYKYEETFDQVPRVNPMISNEDMIRAMKSNKRPGEVNEYVSPNTHVLGWVIENVTGQPLWMALQELIWEKIGAESDALITVNKEGMVYGSGGVSARLRDIARFGEIFTDGGSMGVVSGAHLSDIKDGEIIAFDEAWTAQLAERFSGDGPTHAAWQWDLVWPDGDMYKGGFSGQGLYVSPSRNLVIAYFGTARTDGSQHRLTEMARQLSTSGLFR